MKILFITLTMFLSINLYAESDLGATSTDDCPPMADGLRNNGKDVKQQELPAQQGGGTEVQTLDESGTP